MLNRINNSLRIKISNLLMVLKCVSVLRINILKCFTVVLLLKLKNIDLNFKIKLEKEKINTLLVVLTIVSLCKIEQGSFPNGLR